MNQLFIMRLDDQRYALRLENVERVVRMVEITALPEARSGVLGVINVQGRVLSVLDLRGCFHLPAREPAAEDVLIIARTNRGMVALAADAAEGVRSLPEAAAVPGAKIHPAPRYFEGVVKLADGLVLICDLDRLPVLGPEPLSGGEPEGRSRKAEGSD